MDADWSHDPAALPALHRADRRRRGRPRHRLALHAGRRRGRLGHRPAADLARRQHLRPDRAAASRPNDLTGGFKAWRATTLAAVPFDGVHAGGYVFQIEMTFRASRAGRPHPRGPDHVPRPARRPVEDGAADRRRGARRRRPAPGRGAARAGSAAATGADADRLPAEPGDRRRTPPRRAGDRSTRARREPTAARSAGTSRPCPPRRRPRRHRRAAAPGTGPRAAHRGLPRGLLGAFDADAARRRIVRVPAALATSTIRPTRFGSLEVVGRRLAAADAAAALGGADVDPFLLRGASLGAAWRADRGGAAGAVYHAAGRGDPDRDRACRSSSRCSTSRRGSCPAPTSGRRPRGSASGCAASLLRDAAAVIVGSRGRRAGGPAAAPHPARPDPRRAARAAAGVHALAGRRPAPRGGPRRPPPDPRAERERLGLPERYLVYSGPLRRAPGPRRRCCGRSRALADAGRPAGSPDGRAWPPRVLLVGATPGRSSGAGPGRRPRGRRRAPRLRAAARPTSASRRSSAAPARPSCRSSPTRRACRRSRRSPAGRRSSHPRSGRCRRSSARPGSSSSRAIRSGSPSALATRLGRRPRPRRAGRGRPRAGRRRARRTWADVAARDAARSTPRSAARGCAPERDASRGRDGVAGAVERRRRAGRRRRRLPAVNVTFEPGLHDLDERLADGQRDRLARRRRRSWVGFVSAVFFQVPLIVVAVRRDPGRARCRRRRPRGGACCEPSLSGPNFISMTTTFFGATRSPSARVASASSRRVTERRYVLVLPVVVVA